MRPLRWLRHTGRSAPGLTCREVVELVTDYLDGALDTDQRRRFEDHLRGCDPCVEHLDQVRTTIAVAGRLDSEPVDPATADRLAALYRAWQEP